MQRTLLGRAAAALGMAAVALGGRADLILSEIMYHPPNDEETLEFLEFVNTGTTTLDLGGFQFTAGITYTFPNNTMLAPGEYLVLAKDPAAFVARYGSGARVIGPYSGQLANGGERLRLVDRSAVQVFSVEYGDGINWPQRADGAGSSLERITLTSNSDEFYRWRDSSTYGGTPGRPNVQVVDVVINEVLAHSDDPLEDAIELYNTLPYPVDIGGWYLSDSASNLKRFRIPPGTVIDGWGFVVFYQQQFDDDNGALGFGLDEFGESLYLTVPDASDNPARFADSVHFRASEVNVPFARVGTSLGVDFAAVWPLTLDPQRDERLFPPSVAVFRQGRGEPNRAVPVVGPVVITEIMYHPPDLPGGVDNTAAEYIELYNATSGPIALYENGLNAPWRLRGGVEFSFAPGTTLAPGECLLVVGFDPAADTSALAAFRATYGLSPAVKIVGPWDGRLSNAAEQLWLLRPLAQRPDLSIAEQVVDRVFYRDERPWPPQADGDGPALERRGVWLYGNEALHWRASLPGGTPGRLGAGQSNARPLWRQYR